MELTGQCGGCLGDSGTSLHSQGPSGHPKYWGAPQQPMLGCPGTVAGGGSHATVGGSGQRQHPEARRCSFLGTLNAFLGCKSSQEQVLFSALGRTTSAVLHGSQCAFEHCT